MYGDVLCYITGTASDRQKEHRSLPLKATRLCSFCRINLLFLRHIAFPVLRLF